MKSNQNQTKFYDYALNYDSNKSKITAVPEDHDDRIFLTSRQKFTCLNPSRSLFIFTSKNSFRQFIKFISDSKAFEFSILAVICANCITLGLNVMFPAGDSNHVNAILEYIENVFLGIFTTECIMKIISHGLILHPKSYLRNIWNILDFFIVVTGLLTVTFETSGEKMFDIKGLRAMRVLRPLKLISNLPSLQVIMTLMIVAMKPLLNIFIFILFLIIVFALVGMNLFSGKLHATCYNNMTWEMMDDPRPCRESSIRNDIGYRCKNLADLPTGQEWVCKTLPGAKEWPGPNNGITNFDNILLSMLTVFQALTMEGWTDIMYWLNDAEGRDFVWIFFIMLVFTGSFFMLNLILGVLSGEFRRQKDKLDERRKLFAARRKAQEKDSYIGYKNWIEAGEGIIKVDYDFKNFKIQPNPQFFEQKKTEGEKPEFVPMEVDEPDVNDEVEKFSWKSFKRKLLIKYEQFREDLRKIIKNRIYMIVVITLVFLNTVVLGMEHAGAPDWLHVFQDYANLVFVVLFTIELCLKLIAFGVKKFMMKLFNVFDSIVIVLSIVELVLTMTKVVSNDIGISVLRCLRILRIIKLTRYWDQLRILFLKFKDTIISLSSQLILLALIIVIFALLGMQIFGGNYNFDSGKPRKNFDTFFVAVITVFQIVTGEDWNAEMYNGIESMGGIKKPGAIVALYFIFVFVIGNYLLLNIFLAIIVDTLTEDEDESNEHDEENDIMSDSDMEGDVLDEEPVVSVPAGLTILNGATMLPANAKNDILALNPIKTKNKTRYAGKERRVKITLEETVEEEDIEEEIVDEILTYNEIYAEDKINSDSEYEDHKSGDNNELTTDTKPNAILAPLPPYKSLYIFSSNNGFRQFLFTLINTNLFTNFILVSIIVSSILLALEDPTNKYAPRNKIMNYFDYWFLALFGIELILKILTYGLVMHPGSFLRSVANWIDMIVVLTGIIDKIPNLSGDIGAMRILRVIRVLRPLRAVSRSKKLKKILTSIVKAIKQMWPVMLVYMLLLYMFSVIGVFLFKGSFYECNQVGIRYKDDCKGQFIDIDYETWIMKTVEREWTNNPLNFDNVGQGILTLFVAATFEGYPKLLYLSIDSTREDYSIVQDNRIAMFFFYLVYIVIIAFIMVNLFVGLIIVSFTDEPDNDDVEPELQLTNNEKECLTFALQTRPRIKLLPQTYSQFRVWRFVNSDSLENIISCLIFMNTICLCIRYKGQPEVYNSVLSGLNITFTVLFTVEMFVKFYGFGIRTYFDDQMNVFDFIIVVGSYVDIGFSTIQTGVNINLFRLFRVLRLIKLLRRVKSIRRLIWTFIGSMKTLPWIFAFIVLMFFIFATIGMQFFGAIGVDNPDSSITVNNNFQNFLESVLLLFRSVTGEAWQQIMISCADPVQSRCINSTKTCGGIFAYFYFPAFILICAYMVMNLLVAVIINSFSYLLYDASVLSPQDMNDFVDIWSEYDINATGKMFYKDFENLMTRIDPPLGFGTMCGMSKNFKNFHRMQIPIQSDGTILFNSALFGLVRKSLNIKLPPIRPIINNGPQKTIQEYNEEMRALIKLHFRKTSQAMLSQILPLSRNTVTVGKYYALIMIQKNIRRMAILNKMNKKKTKPECFQMTRISDADFLQYYPRNESPNESEKMSKSSEESNKTDFIDFIWEKIQYAFKTPDEAEYP